MCLCDFFCYLNGGICDYVWICCLMGRGLSEIFWKEISVNYVNVFNVFCNVKLYYKNICLR